MEFKVRDIPILFCSLTFLAQGKTTNAHIFLFHVNLKIKGNGTRPTTENHGNNFKYDYIIKSASSKLNMLAMAWKKLHIYLFS